MLSHVDKENRPGMVDIGRKAVSRRGASARARVQLPVSILELEKDNELFSNKGPVFQTARIAGTMAVKRTSDMIPFCHPLPVDSIDFDLRITEDALVHITCRVKTEWKTGVEMEALLGASVCALTVYDMCQAHSKDIVIQEVKLMEKSGGKSDYSSL